MTSQPSLLDMLDRAPRSTPPIARWLLDYLTTAGVMTESGISRRARLRPCACREMVLAGLDDDVCALEAYVDPVPLTKLGEMLACIEGRRTYELRRLAMRWELDSRSARQITFAPAESRIRADVLRQHRCGSRPLSEPETAKTTFAEAQAHELPLDPPF